MGEKIKLGAEVTATGQLFRHWVKGIANGPDRKEWYTPEWAVHKPVTGIYVGKRTYQNGKISWDRDDGNVFVPDEWFKVALIVTDERENPIPVLYSNMHLQLMEGVKNEV